MFTRTYSSSCLRRLKLLRHHALHTLAKPDPSPAWDLAALHSWRIFGEFADTSDPRGGSVKIYQNDATLRLHHSLYGPLQLEGEVVSSSNRNGKLKIQFGEIDGDVSDDGIHWSLGVTAPRVKPAAHIISNLSSNDASDVVSKVNAVCILGEWIFSEDDVQRVMLSNDLLGADRTKVASVCAGSLQHSVPADWASVFGGRDLFIKGLGKFDVQAAVADHVIDVGKHVVPSVATLRGHGYLRRFLQARKRSGETTRSELHDTHLRELRRLFGTPSMLAEYVMCYQRYFVVPETCNRLDELIDHFDSVPSDSTSKAELMETNPPTLFNILDEEVQKMEWGTDEHFEYLERLPSFLPSSSSQMYEMRILKSTHDVIKAGEHLHNCARIHIPQIKRKRSLLAVLCPHGQPDKLLAIGQWDLKERRWVQYSEACNKRLRPDWKKLFTDAADHMPKVELKMRMDVGNLTAYQDIFNAHSAAALSYELEQVDAASQHGRWLVSKKALKLIMSYGDLTPVTGSELLPFVAVRNNLPMMHSLLDMGGSNGVSLEHVMSIVDDHGQKVFTGTPLLIAAKLGHWQMVKLLIERNANLNASAASGETALHLAVHAGQLDVLEELADKSTEPVLATAALHGDAATVQRLVDLGKDPNATTCDGRSPLMLAARRGELAIAKCLINAGANISLTDSQGRTALVWGLQDKELRVVELLLKNGAEVDSQDPRVQRAFLLASALGDVDLVESLLISGVDINVQDSNERTALILAAARDQRAVLKVLLDEHANISVQDKDGSYAFWAALKGNRFEAAEMLSQAGARIINADHAVANSRLKYRLRVALRQGDDSFIESFARAGMHVGTGHAEFCEALRSSAKGGNLHLVKSLLALQVDFNQPDKWGHTPLISAAWSGYADIIEHLLTMKVDVNAQDCDGRTALMLAVEHSHYQAVRLLVAAGADAGLRDTRGRTLVERLPRSRKDSAVLLLRKCGLHIERDRS